MQRNKKIAIKRQVWNKGLKVGKRDGFTPVQVKRIRGLLADRGTPGLRDRALFATAVDTMLHGKDLVTLCRVHGFPIKGSKIFLLSQPLG